MLAITNREIASVCLEFELESDEMGTREEKAIAIIKRRRRRERRERVEVRHG